MLADLLGPLLRWALWNWRRAALTAAAGFALMAILFQAASAAGHLGASSHRPHHRATPPAVTPAAATPTPAATPPPAAASAAPTETATPAPPPATAPPQAAQAAVAAGENFTAAWADHSRPGWLARVRRYATAPLAARLAVINPAYIPATQVTGPATVTAAAASAVDLSVPTDAGPVLVTVRLTSGGWLADSVMPALPGN